MNARTSGSLRSRLAAIAVAAVLAVAGLHATATQATALSFTLTITRIGTGTGSIGVGTTPCTTYPCLLEEPDGAGVTISTAPAAGSLFVGWTGACAGQGTTCLLTMTADKTTGARFDLPAAATPAPATARPTVTAGPSLDGSSAPTATEGATTGAGSSDAPPAAPSAPSATASAAPGTPAPGNSGDPPWLPIVVAALLALVVVGIAAFRLGTRRNEA